LSNREICKNGLIKLYDTSFTEEKMLDSSIGIDEIIAWFQNKVADYDLQIWERSVMRKELLEKLTVEGSRKSPVPEHLIDLDLVQGNSFPKAKPINDGAPWRPWCQGVSCAVFMPIHALWWAERTSTVFTMILLMVWFIQSIGLSCFLSSSSEHQVPLSEVLIPIIASILLSVLHCHIAQTQAHDYIHFTKTQRRQRREQHSDHLRRSSIFSEIGPFAGIRARLYSKCSDTGTDEAESIKVDEQPQQQRRENQVIRKRKIEADQVDCDLSKNASSESCSSSTASSNARNTTQQRSKNVENIYDTIKNESSSSTSSSDDEEEVAPCGDDSDRELTSQHGSCHNASPDAVKAGPERIHVRLWEEKHWVKASVSLVDLGALIMRKVFQQHHRPALSIFLGFLFSTLISVNPLINRVYVKYQAENSNLSGENSTGITLISLFFEPLELWRTMMAGSPLFVLSSFASRLFTSSLAFFLLTVAQRAYKQRLTAAKHFSHLTLARRARKSDLPHFRLNKVRNIKLWLSLRSYIRRRGAQRSVDTIVSSAFLMTLVFLATIAVGILHGSLFDEDSPVLWEITLLSVTIGVFLMQILTLGSKINKRYLNSSVLYTEQINLYLRMDRKPHKKESLTRANAVLGLAVKLIKEIESPFKVYGLVMNPWLYNVTRMVILSAFSGVVYEIFGFKVKLWKIKG